MMDLVLLDRVAQRADDVFLPHHVGERARAVATVQRGHGGLSLEGPPAHRSGRSTPRRGGPPGALAARGPQPGCPAAPPGARLRLLPSGPDLVHGPTPRGTRPSTPRTTR